VGYKLGVLVSNELGGEAKPPVHMAKVELGSVAIQWAWKVLQCLAVLDYLQCGAIQWRNLT
jgi:hypothetical protein